MRALLFLALTSLTDGFTTRSTLGVDSQVGRQIIFDLETKEWANGDGEAKMSHNTTEDGDYEICFFAPRPVRISFNSFFHHPEKVEKSFQDYLDKHQMNANIKETVTKLFQYLYNILYSIKFYNQISIRDEAMQQMSGDYIQTYAMVFAGTTVLLSIFQVTMIRRMFKIDTKRIRI